MRRKIFIHFSFWFSFFVLISIVRNHISLSYWPFWVGGLIGTVMPDLDHLIYVLFLNPHELTSQRVGSLLKRKEFFRVTTLLYETRDERKNLVFHTFLFQLIFFVLTFFVISSSGSIFVSGMVIALSLHLIVDQLVDIFDIKTLSNWGTLFSSELSYRNSKLYVMGAFLLLFVIGLLM